MNIFFGWILPIIIAVMLMRYVNRTMQGGGKDSPLGGGGLGGMFNLGKSNARVYDKDKTTIRFHDVAGEDEAKENLQEIVNYLHDPNQFKSIGATMPKGILLVGPPGTGKSQTITNLIANALFQGKRVLFVAEKMAALSVVQNRLEKINLGPFCLEMHSNKITKRHVLEQLKKSLNAAHIKRPEEYARIADELYEQRCKLIEYMEALHDTKGQEGMSLFDCIIRYESIDTTELDIDANDEDLKRKFRIEKIDSYSHLLRQKYQSCDQHYRDTSKHPLLGLNIEENEPS